MIVEQKNGQEIYNASSPDELALVNAAKFFGFTFKGRDEDNNLLIEIGSRQVKYRLLNVIEFTSARKRMSVIVRTEDNRIKVMCKGADQIIIPHRLNAKSAFVNETQQFLDSFSKEGLRTLVLAEKEVSEESYQEWNGKYQQALVASTGREDKIAKVAELIENDFNLIGMTAIEDKLQEQVPETIAFMRQTGIKIWVLTGDKIETALNIGISC